MGRAPSGIFKARLHPYAPEEMMQGASSSWRASKMRSPRSSEWTRVVTLQPAAGVRRGSLAGLMMIRAYHAERGRSPKRVLDPRHGPRDEPGLDAPSTGSRRFRFLGGSDRDHPSPEQIANRLLDDDTAAIMITNPNTLGLFEEHLPTIREDGP